MASTSFLKVWEDNPREIDEDDFERLKQRPKRPFSKEQTQSRDYAQIENLHQAGPIAYADFHIINTSSKNYVYSEIDLILKELDI